MNKYIATATWKVKRARTSLTRHILVEANSKEEAELRARAELSAFITRNKAVLMVQEVEQP